MLPKGFRGRPLKRPYRQVTKASNQKAKAEYRGEHLWLVSFAEVRCPVGPTLPSGDHRSFIRHPQLGRKLKCDGRTTCGNCERRGIACVYVPVYASIGVSLTRYEG